MNRPLPQPVCCWLGLAQLAVWMLVARPSAAAAAEYAIGADLSFVRQAEEQGTVFKDAGQAKPGLQIFKDHGYNWIRLRLFHTPTRLPNNLEYTIASAKDAKKLGFKFLLDFHYSDTWADPAKQTIPKAWQGKSHEELTQAVFEYTRETLAAFDGAGVLPDMVQIGNEITPGLLWPDGKLPENWSPFGDLLKAGIHGVKAGSAPGARPRIMIHIDKGGNKQATRNFFDQLNALGVEFDVIGQSYYPWWHGSLSDLRDNLEFMATTYRKDIVLVEVAYCWRPTQYKQRPGPFPETPEGQKQFLAEVDRLVRNTPDHRGLGVFWWEPAVNGPLRSRGFFDDDGNALPVLAVFDDRPGQPPRPSYTWITGYYPAQSKILPISEIPWARYTEVNHFAAAPGVDDQGHGNGTVELHYLTRPEIQQFVSAGHAAGKRVIVTIKDHGRHLNAFRESTAPELVERFAGSIARFAQTNQYDGVDLDWEARVDVDQYTDLLRRLRTALSPGQLLTAAVGNWDNLETVASQAQGQLDHINVMCYDMDNTGSYTWHNDALRQNGDATKMTCDWRVGALVRAGVAKNKIGIGIPFYGRRWTGATGPLQTNGSRAAGWANYGSLINDPVRWQPANQKWDTRYQAEYLSVPQLNEFISYNGPGSIREICRWARQEGFGGFMAYDLANEFNASASGEARYPLSTALFESATGHMRPAAKPRRILYNLDGDSCMTLIHGRTGPGPVTTNDLVRIVTELTQPGSQVDTLLLCVNAQVTYYPTTIGTVRGTLSTPEERARWSAHERQRFTNMQAFAAAGVDPYAVIFAVAKRRGFESLMTFRMNDAHGNDFLRTAFWQDHPEFRLVNGALDFSHDQVREYVFKLIEEAVHRYPCDGLELDFQRFPTFFKTNGPDSTDERIQKMNRLVERIRNVLDAESNKRGQRLVLSVRAPSGYDQQPPTLEKAYALGCDLKEWAHRGWIDFLTVSEWLFTADTLGIQAWKRQIPGIPIYAAIQPETKASLNRAHPDFALAAGGYRKFARERWADGADGLYLFNFFTTREWPEPVEPPFEVLSHLAGPSCGGRWPELRSVRKLWDAAPHNAFTGLARHRDSWYCVFREGSGHIPGTNGTIRVLRSADGEQWSSAALLSETGVDLRDPKLSVGPDGRLMLLMGGSVYAGEEGPQAREFVSAQTRVAFSEDGSTWTHPQPVSVQGEWLWRVTWHGNLGYGFGYTFNVPAKDVSLTLWRTRDGLDYEKVTAPVLPPQCWPDETTARFLSDDTMLALVRNERNGGPAFLGRSRPPYTHWEWKNSGRTAQGPDLVALDEERLFYAGRDYVPGAVTAFGSITSAGAMRQFVLPSGGDTSYPGLVGHAGQLWMSYYSSHEGKASIYLARIDVPLAKRPLR